MRGVSKRQVTIIIALVVLVLVAFAFTTSVSTLCLDGPEGIEPPGCETQYINELFGWRFGGSFILVFDVVVGVTLVALILCLLIAGGWMLQRFMDRREFGGR